VYAVGFFVHRRERLVAEPAPTALRDAAQHPRVLATLGSPLTCSYFWKGTVTDLWADLLLPVSGPAGQGHMHVKAIYEAGAWHYIMFLAELPNNEVVSLIRPPPQGKLRETVPPPSTQKQ
jgi:hypothetical protein